MPPYGTPGIAPPPIGGPGPAGDPGPVLTDLAKRALDALEQYPFLRPLLKPMIEALTATVSRSVRPPDVPPGTQGPPALDRTPGAAPLVAPGDSLAGLLTRLTGQQA